MGIIGIGKETYLYVNGISCSHEINLRKDVTLIPVDSKMKFDIVSKLTQLPPSEDGGLLWSKDHFLRLKVACRLKPVSFATKVA